MSSAHNPDAGNAKIVVVLGAGGFVGKNLMLRLAERPAEFHGIGLTRSMPAEDATRALAGGDVIINLAGVNRPQDDGDFLPGNAAPVEQIIAALNNAGRAVPVIHISSSRAGDGTPYGMSKLAAEQMMLAFAGVSGNPVQVLRLPNIFGKWALPNYNSAVATFCHNIARGLPIRVDNPAAPLTLTYVDDVIDRLFALIADFPAVSGQAALPLTYQTNVGAVADMIRGFRSDRDDNLIAEVGTGLPRALYSTYVASLPPADFAYPIVSHRDPRGAFSEMLKTRTSGQFSYFNALPGVTRGGHYHHSKTEKFLIVYGTARFRFRHMLTGEEHEVVTSADTPVVVETVPGWTHDVTNIGDEIMVSMLWANEIFEPARPDTIAEKL